MSHWLWWPGVWRHTGVRGGAPCIAGTGIGCEFIASRFAAGERIEEIADDYGISAEQVTEAIRLVVKACFGRQGLLSDVERRMEDIVPVTARSLETDDE